MKITSKKLYGFTITKEEYVEEVGATLFDMTHDKSGARLILLDRADENATFAIGFKTVPTDDTGVFHIMEHSVLCGSKKFPVKDPFTELLKGSVSTYLNALTAGDKTLYPVSSKNSKAFRGLVDVYLDAVFNPLVLENPFIFMQEGHRYELDENGELSVTGVVYNEMQGVYSTADDYADYLISRRVCPGSTYSYDSGGNPDFIPELTYEGLVSAHEKFYHPSNAYLFLDGDVVIDEILPLIDSYLSEYEKRDTDIPIDNGNPPLTEIYEDTYPIEKEEDPKDKTRVYLCHNSYSHEKREELSALSLVTEALADLNTAPLTKKILDTGLCESFTLYTTRSYSLNALNVFFTGVKDGKESEVIAAYDKAIDDILSEGIPRDILSSALRRREFNVRESDFGTFPAGMVYMRSCLENAILGEDPAEALRYEHLLSDMREKLGTGYYEDVIRDVINSPRATIILHPDSEFTEKKEAVLNKKLKEIAAEMSEDDKASLRAELDAFDRWQSTPDTPEQLSTLPTLTIEDLNTEPKRIPTDVSSYNGCEIITHPLHTGGISYAELYFDASDATEDDLHYIRLFTDLIFEWDSDKRSVTELRNATKAHLGAFYLTPHPTLKENTEKLYLLFNASCLDCEKENALEIIDEYLYRTRIDNVDVLKQNVRQHYTFSLEGITSRGDSYANMRDAAKHSTYNAITEHLFGYEYHRFIKELSKNIDKEASGVLARLEDVRRTYFCRERLTVGITEQDGYEFAKRITETVRQGGAPSGPSPVLPIEKVNEGIAIPSSISFASRVGSTENFGKNLYTGAHSVMQSIISLELLWNEIRLKRGAYDTGFFSKPSGTVGCYSYRDPSPEASVEYFMSISDEFDKFLDTEPELLKYIIGVFGASDTVTTPRNDGSTATKRYLSGRTHELIVKRRRECLSATVEELRSINNTIREAMIKSSFTVVGPRDELEKITGIHRILDI